MGIKSGKKKHPKNKINRGSNPQPKAKMNRRRTIEHPLSSSSHIQETGGVMAQLARSSGSSGRKERIFGSAQSAIRPISAMNALSNFVMERCRAISALRIINAFVYRG